MLFGINGVSIISGHGIGANRIKSKYVKTAAEKAYSEGTAMFKLCEYLQNVKGVENIRTGEKKIGYSYNRTTRAKMMAKTSADLCISMHTNWSTDRNDNPNSGVFTVYVSMYNPIHNVAEQKAMAEKLFKPVADELGLKFKVATKKGGGKWDYYTYLQYCSKYGVPYPMLIENGYHIDYANDEERFMKAIYKNFQRICEDTTGVPDMEYTTYMVNNYRKSTLHCYETANKDWGVDLRNGTVVEVLGFNGAWLHGQVVRDHKGNKVENGVIGYLNYENYMSPHDYELIYEAEEPVENPPDTTKDEQIKELQEENIELHEKINELEEFIDSFVEAAKELD